MEYVEIYHKIIVEKSLSKIKILQMILSLVIIGIGIYEFFSQGKIRIKIIILAIFLVFSALKGAKSQSEEWITTRIIDNYNSLRWEYPNMPTQKGKVTLGYEMDYGNIVRMVYNQSQNYFVLESYPMEIRYGAEGKRERIDHLLKNHLVTLSIQSPEVKKVVDFCERLMPTRIEYV